MTPRSRALDEMVRLLRVDSRVQHAAYVGVKFGIDPVVVLTEPDMWRYAVRVAVGEIVADAEAKARKGK